MSLQAGLLPPRYRGPQPIGRGAMGEIYRATDDVLGRAVAIKLLSARYASDDSIRSRFTREALAAARLSSEPNIVTIYDVGEWNDRPFLVMEYLGGGSLDARLRSSRPPLAQALRWLEQAALALDTAHRHGVVHRDVKPANLLLDRDGNVHVGDFGIASAAGLDSLTIAGTVLGTAGYLSPEQARGERATPASDRYALAVVAFELLAGTRPFEADSPTAEATAHASAPVPSASARRPDLPLEVDEVFARALAKDPAARPATCADLVAALRDALAAPAPVTRVLAPAARPRPAPSYPKRGRARRMLRVAVGAAAALAAGGIAGAVVATRGNHSPSSAPSVRATTITAQGRTETVTIAATTAAFPPRSARASSGTAAPPGSDGHSLNDRGYALMRRGDYASALPLLRSAVAQLAGAGPSDPYEAYANYNLGYTLLSLGRCGDALRYLRRADRLEGPNADVDRALARARRC